jgi:hypothetical protein
MSLLGRRPPKGSPQVGLIVEYGVKVCMPRVHPRRTDRVGLFLRQLGSREAAAGILLLVG